MTEKQLSRTASEIELVFEANMEVATNLFQHRIKINMDFVKSLSMSKVFQYQATLHFLTDTILDQNR